MKAKLETRRLILRPFELDDANDIYYGWACDSEVTKYLTWNPHKNIDDTKLVLSKWIEQYEKVERINFAITLKDDNQLIGAIDVVGYIGGVPVIGYVLSKKHWNKGYMSEACKKVIEYLFSLGHKKIIIDAQVENIASNNVIKKCGGKFFETYTEFFPMKAEKRSINRYFISIMDE